MSDLNKKAFGGLFLLLVAMGALLFLPAWTFAYWQAWLFLAVFGIATLTITVYLIKKDPKLLERRVNAGSSAEKERSQKIIQFVAQIAFVAVFLSSALDYRFGWSSLSIPIIVLGNFLIAFGLFIVFLVFKENSFTSAIIEVNADQKVVSTGPYAIVRHPMYAGAFVMLIGIPLALDSLWGLIAVALLMFAIIYRLLDEENFLVKNLPGYAEYKQKVKYRLLPFIW